MNEHDVLEWLEGEMRGCPERATGNEPEDLVVRLAGRIAKTNRNELAGAMRHWIRQRSPRTLLAVRIAAEHQLHELKSDIQQLLEEVRAGKAFSPYYEEFIQPALVLIE